MWTELASAAISAFGRGSGGPKSIASGAPNFIDAGFDSSQWTVATGGSRATADNRKSELPALAGLAAQSQAPYVNAGGGLSTAGLGDLSMEGVLPVVLLAFGLAFVVRKGKG